MSQSTKTAVSGDLCSVAAAGLILISEMCKRPGVYRLGNTDPSGSAVVVVTKRLYLFYVNHGVVCRVARKWLAPLHMAYKTTVSLPNRVRAWKKGKIYK